jgi:hypothetical protein
MTDSLYYESKSESESESYVIYLHGYMFASSFLRNGPHVTIVLVAEV